MRCGRPAQTPLCGSALSFTGSRPPQVFRHGAGGYWRASKRWCKTLPVELVDKALLSFAHNGEWGVVSLQGDGRPGSCHVPGCSTMLDLCRHCNAGRAWSRRVLSPATLTPLLPSSFQPQSTACAPPTCTAAPAAPLRSWRR